MALKQSLLTTVLLIVLMSSMAIGQQLPPSGLISAAGGQPYERLQLAIELAKTAAENGSQDLSLEAFKRLMDDYSRKLTAPAPQPKQTTSASGIQSSLLGTPPENDPFGAPQINARTLLNSQMNGPIVMGQAMTTYTIDPQMFLIPLIELQQIWKTANFDPVKVTEALQRIVLPADSPQSVQLFAAFKNQTGPSFVPRTVTRTTVAANGARTTTTTTINVPSSTQRGANPTGISVGREMLGNVQRFHAPEVTQSLGMCLIDWAVAANRLEPILKELETRSNPGNGKDAIPLIIYGYRSLGDVDRAANHVNRLLESNSRGVPVAPYQWAMILQSAMQPLAKDQARLIDLSGASAQLPDETMNLLMQSALNADLVGASPYFHELIRRAIRASDVQRISELVGQFVRQIDTIAGTSTGSTVVQNNVWNEVVTESIRLGQPHVALHALRYVENKKTDPIARSFRDETRRKALLALCELPIEKRVKLTQSLLAEDFLTSIEALHFCSVPECEAPLVFRSATWQAAARLLQADPHFSTISLLDLLLSDAETNGKLDETIDQLFARLPNGNVNDPQINRLVCVWTTMRAEIRGLPVPARIVTENSKLSQTDFAPWYLNSAPEVRRTLATFSVRKPDSETAQWIRKIESDAAGLIEQTADKQTAPEDKKEWKSSDSLRHWVRIEVPEPPNSQGFAGYGQLFTQWHISPDKHLRSFNTSAALMLKYPLEGNYGLRCKVIGNGDDWSNSSFGGMIHGTFLEYRGRTQSGSRVTLATLNGRLTGSLSSSFRLNENPEVTPTVDVECAVQDRCVSLTLNGKKLAHSEFLSRSFPFVGLIPLQSPALQGDVEIVGSPKIATEVNLLDPSFSGWSARRYDRLLTNAIQLHLADQSPVEANPSTSQLASWRLEDNELHSEGKISVANSSDPQVIARKSHNCMLYARPLLKGEQFEYEVWTDTNTPAVAPVIGLTAMLIEDGKIRLHWLPSASDIQSSGIAVDNRGDDPQAEQLATAKLNESEWNKVVLRIDGSHMILRINGMDIYRRPIPENKRTEFGWLSDPEQPSVRIRNAKLKGDWPDKLPEPLWETN